MKKALKIFSVISVLLLVNADIFADIHKSSRIIEFGVDNIVDVNQNTLSVKDYLKEELVIDFTQISKGMSSSGFEFNALADSKAFFNFAVGGFKVGIDTGLDGNASFAIGKDFFEILGKGNSESGSFDTTLSMKLQSYYTLGTTLRMNMGNLGITVKPTYFVPLVYVPKTKMTVSIINAEDGSVKTSVKNGDFDIYSAVKLDSYFDSDFNFNGMENFNADELITALSSAGGLDLTLLAELPVTNNCDAGIYTRVPVIKGKLKYRTTGNLNLDNVYVDPLLDSLISDGLSYKADPEFTMGETEEADYKVNRPFRFGAEACWTPFGNWFRICPSLGIACNNPFSEDSDENNKIYPEYSLTLESRIVYVFRIGVTTEYTQEIFAQMLNTALNFRLFEFDFAIGSSGSDFANTFKGSGVKAKVGIKAGL